MTEEKAALCKKYCGAVAVSWYRSPHTLRAIECLLKQGVKTNIHYVLGKNTIYEALGRLKLMEKEGGFPKGINAVIFLLHKPIGQGSNENIVTMDNSEFKELIYLIDMHRFPYKIGFDSCTVPALLTTRNTDFVCLDTCEGGRWSAYISADMQMLPCSFAHEMKEYRVSLKEHTIKEVWDSEAFEDFRNCFKRACPGCEKRGLCMGGCPILPEIVLCGEKISQ